jgi:hypothetical protein
MTVVLGIFTFFFFVTLFLMCYYRSKINTRLINALFIVADLLAFSCWTYAGYQRGWINEGWMTLDNISPLMFTLILLTPFMNEKAKDYVYSAIAFLNVGMFFAMLISPEHDYIFNFNTEATFIYTTEAVCHMVCSLYGIYLVLSKRVKADFNHWIKSVVLTLSIITVGVICNFVFHRKYFGMDPYGSAHIYMLDLFGGFWATIVAYYFGVVMVLTVGYQGVNMLDKTLDKIFEHSHRKAEGKHFTIDEHENDDLDEIMISVNLTESIDTGTEADPDSEKTYNTEEDIGQ